MANFEIKFRMYVIKCTTCKVTAVTSKGSGCAYKLAMLRVDSIY